MQLSTEDRDWLGQEFMFGGAAGGRAAIASLFPTNLTRRELCLDVLRPVADHLGAMWLRDEVTFMSVRVATSRMEALLQTTADPADVLITKKRKQAVFASVPGDDHTFGIQMAADLQRAKGWDIQLVANANVADLLAEIVHSPAEILGLSIGSSSSMHALYTTVRMVKLHRPDIKILVSGALVGIDALPIERLSVTARADCFERAETLLDTMLDTTPTRSTYSDVVTVLPPNFS
ncbi:cobalamin B12-binding domain-containing protein [Loktanella sp. M215]|uniref:cobalamin B12-binding domain-containing protein n=1 Tax=Loktanella sp. M215 TaxID=2675431 RepID=UPI001F34745D|nr:cobalamin B12-binding domain-containing protein [Loktanella sp. M215]